MRVLMIAALTAAGAALPLAAPASAGVVEEFRLGVMQHDLDVLNEGSGGKEDGFNVTGSVVLATPGILQWAWDPEPFGMFSWNSDGGTNFGAVGLKWDRRFTDRFFGEFDFGYAIHDGVVELPPNPGDPVRIRLAETRVIFGSRDLFYSSLSAGLRVTDHVDTALVFEHLSHGQILAEGKNEGLDTFGLRFSYRFGE